MAEVTVDAEPTQIPGRPPAPGRLPITNISQWMERYSLMAAALASRFPAKAAELFAYQATIVRAERNYEPGRWVAYDRQFRREALARRDLNWSVTDTRLYNEAFTGRARAIPRCSFCLQDDHSGQQCPQNPDRPWFGWFPNPSMWVSPTATPSTGSASRQVAEICRRFNEGRCRQQRCRYTHICKECGAQHPWLSCPLNQARHRSRSPHRPLNTGAAQLKWPAGQTR